MLMDLLDRLPDLMRERRAEMGLSQTDLAKLVKVYPSTIHRIESGERTPGSSLLLAILQALRSGLDDLVS